MNRTLSGPGFPPLEQADDDAIQVFQLPLRATSNRGAPNSTGGGNAAIDTSTQP